MIIMAQLKLRNRSLVGVPDYLPESEDEGKRFIIAIMTEGCKEEVLYLKYIRKLCQEKSSKNIIVEIVNDEYADEKVAVSDSHPQKRLEALRERMGYADSLADEAWLVSDRDDGSFTEGQYDEVRDVCTESNIRWVVSNPAFQLWLLFHFTDSLEGLCLERCVKSSLKIKQIEKELNKYVRGYKHGTLDMIEFGDYIENAIVNSSDYCMDVADLKKGIGTNFSLLVKSLKEKFEIETLTE